MGIISDKCVKKLHDEAHEMDFVNAAGWILAREYKRVHAPSEIQAWDDAVKAFWQSKDAGADPGPEAQAFAKASSDLVKKSGIVPGWDVNACSMNWGQLAAFANWAAKQGTTKIKDLTKSTVSGQAISYEVDPAIRDDLAYATAWAKPGQPGTKAETPVEVDKKTNWTPWLVGAGALAAAIGGYVMLRKPSHVSMSAAQQNPSTYSPSKYPFKATAKGMSSKWRSYTQVFSSEQNAVDFLREMIDRYGAKTGVVFDRKTNQPIQKLVA